MFLFYGSCLKALRSSIMCLKPVLLKQTYESLYKEEHTLLQLKFSFSLPLRFNEFSCSNFKIGMGTNLI